MNILLHTKPPLCRTYNKVALVITYLQAIALHVLYIQNNYFQRMILLLIKFDFENNFLV